jgi:hypothetical protein
VTGFYAATGAERLSVALPGIEGDVPLDLPINVLTSFHFYRNTDMAEMASWGLRIIADSGAFSAANAGAYVDLDAYVEWIQKWRVHLHWLASLDVIGDSGKSWANWRSLKTAGVESVPTIHYPAEPSELDRYVEAGADFIGLGGMVPYKSEPQRLLRWSAQVMRYARHAGGRDVAAHRRLLADHYGLDDWRRIARSDSTTRRDLIRVSLRALQLAEDFMTRRWQVQPPASLRDAPPGPAVHAALGAPAMQPSRSLSPTDTPPKELP